MLNIPKPGSPALAAIQLVVDAVVAAAPDLNPESIMLVGAHCRDVLHAALGHRFPTHTTTDLDLALALSSWSLYEQLTEAFEPTGSNEICYLIANLPVDLIAFGGVENPTGTVTPPPRDEGLSVWAFEEILTSSLPLTLHGTTIRIPNVSGYTAAKLGAWLDRSDYGESKDARDIALSLHWYAESATIERRLYETETGIELLSAEEMDVPRAAARLLGTDVIDLIGSVRQTELLDRWPGNVDMLAHHLVSSSQMPWPSPRRHQLIEALTRGLSVNG